MSVQCLTPKWRISVFMRRFWTAVAERSGDTTFRLRIELSKRRGASLPAAVQNLVAAPHHRQSGKYLGKERRIHAAAGQKGSLCRLKPAFLGGGAKLRPFQVLPVKFPFLQAFCGYGWSRECANDDSN